MCKVTSQITMTLRTNNGVSSPVPRWDPQSSLCHAHSVVLFDARARLMRVLRYVGTWFTLLLRQQISCLYVTCTACWPNKKVAVFYLHVTSRVWLFGVVLSVVSLLSCLWPDSRRGTRNSTPSDRHVCTHEPREVCANPRKIQPGD